MYWYNQEKDKKMTKLTTKSVVVGNAAIGGERRGGWAGPGTSHASPTGGIHNSTPFPLPRCLLSPTPSPPSLPPHPPTTTTKHIHHPPSSHHTHTHATNTPSHQQPTPSPPPGPFELVDQDGKPFTEKDLLGEFAMLYFGFTFCPDVCPEELEKISGVADFVGERAGGEGGGRLGKYPGGPGARRSRCRRGLGWPALWASSGPGKLGGLMRWGVGGVGCRGCAAWQAPSRWVRAEIAPLLRLGVCCRSMEIAGGVGLNLNQRPWGLGQRRWGGGWGVRLGEACGLDGVCDSH